MHYDKLNCQSLLDRTFRYGGGSFSIKHIGKTITTLKEGICTIELNTDHLLQCINNKTYELEEDDLVSSTLTLLDKRLTQLTHG